MTQFGQQFPLVVHLLRDATSIAVNTDVYTIPPTGTAYKLTSCTEQHSVVSTSGTLKIRAISDTSAPGAAASTTVVELIGTAGVNTLSTAGTINTVVTVPIIGDIVLAPGTRIALLSGGTQTGLVGCQIVLVLTPVNNYV